MTLKKVILGLKIVGGSVLATVFVVLIAAVLTSCFDAVSVDPKDSAAYEYATIDGMTCLYLRTGRITSSLTCNWSEWNGKRDLIISK